MLDEDSDVDISDYGEEAGVKKKTFRGLKTKQHFFEHDLAKKEKGTYKVWRTTIKPVPTAKVTIYLHAVNDSKPVYRISNRHAALPSVVMNATVIDPETGRKVLVEKRTSSAHKCFRMKMSDRLRSRIGLSGKYYRSWPKHLLAKILEDAIINAYANYLLDSSCKVESFTVFLLELVQELIDSGENFRSRKVETPIKRSYRSASKRPLPGSDEYSDRVEMQRRKIIGNTTRTSNKG